MCGRFTLTVDEFLILVERFGITGDLPEEYQPSYNIAPSQKVLVVARGPEGNRAGFLKWGLLPSWAKEPQKARRLINARSETVSEKPSFRSAFKNRRCLIPADGFYEWKKEGNKKIPYRFYLPGEKVFAFAGIWEEWKGGAGEIIRTVSILTQEADEKVKSVHDRMPVILSPAEEQIWLEEKNNLQKLIDLLEKHRGPELRAYQVSEDVNSPRNNSPKLLENQQTLF